MGIDSIFGIGGPELLVILILAGIVLGPKRIAQVANWLGKTTAYLQNISRGFANQLREELNELDPGDDLKEMMSEMTTLRNEVNQLQKQLSGSVQDAVKETKETVQETVNSIRPPSLELDTDLNGTDASSEVDQGAEDKTPPAKQEERKPPPLPELIEVADDPD